MRRTIKLISGGDAQAYWSATVPKPRFFGHSRFQPFALCFVFVSHGSYLPALPYNPRPKHGMVSELSFKLLVPPEYRRRIECNYYIMISSSNLRPTQGKEIGGTIAFPSGRNRVPFRRLFEKG